MWESRTQAQRPEACQSQTEGQALTRIKKLKRADFVLTLKGILTDIKLISFFPPPKIDIEVLYSIMLFLKAQVL